MSTILITGANRGIGLELCRQLVERGDNVIATCRNPSAELNELGVTIVNDVDVSSDASVKTLADKLKGKEIDVLINNAGILSVESINNLNFDQMREQFEVNTLSPLRVTSALLDNLKTDSKVIFITSRMGSIDDNGSGGYYGYRMSKAALNMGAVSLARDLRSRKIAVGILHPGMVATQMTGMNGIPPAQSASGLIARIDELNIDNSGHFFHANGEELPW